MDLSWLTSAGPWPEAMAAVLGAAGWVIVRLFQALEKAQDRVTQALTGATTVIDKMGEVVTGQENLRRATDASFESLNRRLDDLMRGRR